MGFPSQIRGGDFSRGLNGIYTRPTLTISQTHVPIFFPELLYTKYLELIFYLGSSKTTMPSISTVSGYTYSNYGPVTTTFTAPSTCTSHSDQIQLGPSTTRPLLLYGLQCETIGGTDCIPSPTSKLPTSQDNNPSIYFQAAYYSPGLNCPVDWNTVGVATRGDGSSISTSGILVPTTTPTALHRDRELFLEILDHGETAILCCPR